MVNDVDVIKRSFIEKIEKRVGEKYSTIFDEKKVILRETIEDVAKSSKNALFLGYTGTGKTMSMIYLAWLRYQAFEMERAKNLKEEDDCWLPHYRIHWYHCVEMCKFIKEYASNGAVFSPRDEIYIDDFGIFTMAPWEQADLEYFFEVLYRNSVRVYLTTNLTEAELKEDKYRRILSRITQNCKIVNFGQEDLRRKHDY